MMFSAALLSLLALPFAAAQTSHAVTVGAGGKLVYDPTNITAAAGDSIVFTFAGTHTATESTFSNPCSPMSNGFAGTSSSSPFTIQVNDTNPIWVYCAVPGHCSAGMVFSVNAPTTGTNTYAAFKQIAMGGSPPSGSGSSTSSGASPSASSSSGSSSTGPYGSSGAGKVAVSAGASLAVGALVALVL
ncbi:hypothetical protein BOTBODRAFT_170493 [Botryobasidium botryosum FD-172 SS1]|uniref:Phytocyanin domain-containing protein n=1 Tax=Botryobasidium botryosum (strain FD-172 SS1) TaxID=930990 RepID=A0A067MUX2_BOTB1|nr:hypothetical protein BOTBODRAFT_170493 [Botryobasidium botryosum FD-172 SS1]